MTNSYKYHKSKFNINRYTEDDHTMHCDTLEKAIIFCKYLDRHNRTWWNGERYTDNNKWEEFKEFTLYFFNDDCIGDTLNPDGAFILEFDDFDWSEENLEIINQLKNINDNSTITITSTNKEDYILKQVSNNEYTLYIPITTESISLLFENNKKIKKFKFENWDSSNIKDMEYTFAFMELDEMPDFSQQDFSNVTIMERMFYKTIVKGNFYFANHTLNNLEQVYEMFSYVKCHNLIVDLGHTNIQQGDSMFCSIKCNNVMIKISFKETPNIHFIFQNINVNKLDLKDLDMNGNIEWTAFLGIDNWMSINELIMPNVKYNEYPIADLNKNILQQKME